LIAPRFDIEAKRYVYWQKKKKKLARERARVPHPRGSWIAGKSKRR
jgi:hypothetical protein